MPSPAAQGLPANTHWYRTLSATGRARAVTPPNPRAPWGYHRCHTKREHAELVTGFMGQPPPARPRAKRTPRASPSAPGLTGGRGGLQMGPVGGVQMGPSAPRVESSLSSTPGGQGSRPRGDGGHWGAEGARSGAPQTIGTGPGQVRGRGGGRSGRADGHSRGHRRAPGFCCCRLSLPARRRQSRPSAEAAAPANGGAGRGRARCHWPAGGAGPRAARAGRGGARRGERPVPARSPSRGRGGSCLWGSRPRQRCWSLWLPFLRVGIAKQSNPTSPVSSCSHSLRYKSSQMAQKPRNGSTYIIMTEETAWLATLPYCLITQQKRSPRIQN